MFVCLRPQNLNLTFVFTFELRAHFCNVVSLYVCTVTVAQCVGASVECSDSEHQLVGIPALWLQCGSMLDKVN